LDCTIEEAERDLFGSCQRMRLRGDSPLYALLREYTRLKQAETPEWQPPTELDSA
jgi:hypothetical protein